MNIYEITSQLKCDSCQYSEKENKDFKITALDDKSYGKSLICEYKCTNDEADVIVKDCHAVCEGYTEKTCTRNFKIKQYEVCLPRSIVHLKGTPVYNSIEIYYLDLGGGKIKKVNHFNVDAFDNSITISDETNCLYLIRYETFLSQCG